MGALASSFLHRLPGRLAASFVHVLLAACAVLAPAQEPDPPPPLRREFRAAWVATVNNIDWPSRPGLPTAVARAELDALVARAAELRLNALVFQVRPAADAFYRSSLEPWSEWLTGTQGKAPDEAWDPLQHAIDACHRHGLQLHAWCNPYRAWHQSARSSPARNHVLSKQPAACLRYGNYRWMDPGDERSAAWSLAVIRDIVTRYDVDGIHLDDYFYPYPEGGKAFPDDTSYARYREHGGRLSRSDWRRANIDAFVQELYATVHAEKPWVQVGISPFGIARPGVPKGIAAGVDQYEHLSADVGKWLREGWVDYLAPQLYWPIDQKPQSFAVLLPWWLSQNGKQRHVWPGLDTNRMAEGAPPVRSDELADQIGLIRAASQSPGFVLYSFRQLRRDLVAVGGVLRGLQTELVLAPASPWLDATVPPSPVAEFERKRGLAVRWEKSEAVRFVVVQVRSRAGWRTHAIVGAEVGVCEIPDGATSVALTAISRTGVASKTVQATAE